MLNPGKFDVGINEPQRSIEYPAVQISRGERGGHGEPAMNMDALTDLVIGCGIRVHKALGSGMLESAYEAALAHALSKNGLFVERQKLVPVHFEGEIIDGGFRADLIVDHRLLIELKSVDRLVPVHAKQVQTYLRFLDLPVGLLMNFGAPTLGEGLKRIVNGYRPDGSSPLAVNRAAPQPPRFPRETF